MRLWRIPGMPARCSAFLTRILKLHFRLRRVTLLDGKLVMAGKLPTREDIARWAGIPLSQDWSEDSTQPRCCSIPRMP